MFFATSATTLAPESDNGQDREGGGMIANVPGIRWRSMGGTRRIDRPNCRGGANSRDRSPIRRHQGERKATSQLSPIQ